MSKKLKAGLAWFIAKVELMDPETRFVMCQYDNCVIGKTMNLRYWNEKDILKCKFGIQRKEDDAYFSEDMIHTFLPHQANVIALFTSSVSAYTDTSITAKVWLKIAKEQLEKM